MAETIKVEVALALQEQQWLLSLDVLEGATAEDAVRSSRLLEQLPVSQREAIQVGIHGRVLANPAARILISGERVEIYRALLADPKESRKRRAGQAKGRMGR